MYKKVLEILDNIQYFYSHEPSETESYNALEELNKCKLDGNKRVAILEIMHELYVRPDYEYKERVRNLFSKVL